MAAEEFLKERGFSEKDWITFHTVVGLMEAYADKPVWTPKKPEFKDECLLITANFIRKEWEYQIFQIRWIDFDDNAYLGWFTGIGEEYGDLKDLSAQLYQVQPLPEKP